MEVTVLGKSPSWQDAGGACSGYLVSAGSMTVLIDCGNGVMGKLRERIDYLDLDAVVISHIHGDHVLDLAPLAYALTLSPRRQAGGENANDPPPPPLHLPPGGAEKLRRLVGAWGSDDLIDEAFDVIEYAGGEPVAIGDAQVLPTPVPHFTEAFALTFDEDGRRFTFSADCGPNPALVEAARGNQLLLCEATIRQPDAEPRGHMTPAEAGQQATAAAVERLVLTHITDEIDLGEARDRAAAEFSGPIEVAEEGAVYVI